MTASSRPSSAGTPHRSRVPLLITLLVIAGVTIALLAAALLTGGAGSRQTFDTEVQSVPAAQADAQGLTTAESLTQQQVLDGQSATDRSIITTGQIGITTSDVAAAAQGAERIVADLDGRVESRSEYSGEQLTSTLTLRVPADSYERAIEQLRSLGTVSYVETWTQDVTLQQVDLEARIDALQTSIGSLRSMLSQTANVADLLEVERELSSRQAELQSLEAQLEVLQEQVSLSTLTLTISNDEVRNPTPQHEGFWGGLQAGWAALVGFLGWLATALGFILPGAVLLALMAGAVLLLLRSRRRRIAATAVGPGGSAGSVSDTAVSGNSPIAASADDGPAAGSADELDGPAAGGSGDAGDPATGSGDTAYGSGDAGGSEDSSALAGGSAAASGDSADGRPRAQ